jgi:hypothetical protein
MPDGARAEVLECATVEGFVSLPVNVAAHRQGLSIARNS